MDNQRTQNLLCQEPVEQTRQSPRLWANDHGPYGLKEMQPRMWDPELGDYTLQTALREADNLTYEEACQFVACLNRATYFGSRDWGLPGTSELMVVQETLASSAPYWTHDSGVIAGELVPAAYDPETRNSCAVACTDRCAVVAVRRLTIEGE